MFRTSVPVTAEAFLDRDDALRRLTDLLAALRAGAPSWLCILGPRKVGKTSLLLELARRTTDPSVLFVVLDVFETMPVSVELFRRYAIRVVDAAFSREVGVSLEAVADRPVDYRGALQRSERFAALPAPVRADVLELPEHIMNDPFLRVCLELPERIAEALGVAILVAVDEFQELGVPLPGGRDGELLPLIRSVWQRHRRVAYVISGSARTMLLELVTKEHSPFFQHFSLMELGPFSQEDGIRLLLTNAPEGRRIRPDLAERAVDLLGGHPFYLQLFGETLTAQPPPYDEGSLKEAVQELLFSRSGRLALYFENEFDRLVGRSTYLAATLSALSEGPLRLGQLARATHAQTGATVRSLERLGDAVVHDESGEYRLADATFGLWLRWRRPGGTVVPMKVVGDEAEQAAAEYLALTGFELVYQSRASRGAFDLLATRGPHQLGVQVKRSPLPVRFTAPEWARMVAEGKRLNWHWIVAAVTPPPEGKPLPPRPPRRPQIFGERVIMLDPRKVRSTGKGVRLGEPAAIDNLLLWLDGQASIRTGREAP